MTQHSESQYDDLTAGMDDDSLSTDSVNLFEFSSHEESPIARLKTIILSIDWEINDDILQQLSDELLDLNDVWSGDKIKKIYIQGLDKIGKYINKERAGAHPDAIKVLLHFYHSLEKLVSSEDSMSEEEKKQLLMKDVKKFDQLKLKISQIAPQPRVKQAVGSAVVDTGIGDAWGKDNPLKVLKAQVLGIDWEINDRELESLAEEVKSLEGIFGHSKAKLILLQGIGALGAYINKKRGQSDSNAFTLLHSFYDSLEKITLSDLSGDEEKTILLAEVAKFNVFKQRISADASQDTLVGDDSKSKISRKTASPATKISAPAFSGMEETQRPAGDDEAKVVADVESRLDSVFGDENVEQSVVLNSDESALAGVNVETEADDDSDEEALPLEGGAVAPALVDAEEESSYSVDSLAEKLAESAAEEAALEQDEVEETVLQGVDVECEADDDSDEEALPTEQGELAPALSDSDEGLGFSEDRIEAESEAHEDGDLENRLDSFFDDEIEASADDLSAFGDADAPAPALADSVYDFTIDDEEVEEEFTDGLSFLDDDTPAPALEESVAALEEEGEEAAEEEFSAGLSFLDDEVPAPAFEESVAAPEEEGEEAAEEEFSAGLSFLDEEVPAPALEESVAAPEEEGEEGAEEEFSAGLSFLDEEVPAPALEESVAAPEEEREEAAEEEFSAGLSFLDEEVPAPAPEESVAAPEEEREEAAEEEFSAGLSFLDEEVPAPAPEESVVAPEEEREEAAEEEFSAGLSFLDEEVVTPSPISDEPLPPSAGEDEVSAQLSEEENLSFEEIAESTEEEIHFSVPGEAFVDTSITEVAGEEGDDDVIHFMVPGEEAATQQILSSEEQEEVVFEVVGDDVEVDPLPAESVVDSLQTAIQALQGSINETTIQELYNCVNSQRNLLSTTNTDKIFLQLLSTTCQKIEKDGQDASTSLLALLDSLYEGLEYGRSSSLSEQTQEKIMECTAQLLILLQKD